MKKVIAGVAAAVLVVVATLAVLLVGGDLQVTEVPPARPTMQAVSLEQEDEDLQSDARPIEDVAVVQGEESGVGILEVPAPRQGAGATLPFALPGLGRDPLEGLPGNLLPLPEGRVRLGLDAETLHDVSEQTQPFNINERVRGLKNSLSELGLRTVDIEPFLLGEFPVTNEEYRAFVEETGHRFPYHWWRYGEQNDYLERLPAIRQQFPGAREIGPFLYWERHFNELPWKLEDAAGKYIGKQPVFFVSWRDAMAYAAWAGMRLPTEEEWTYAARGEGKAVWVWGENKETEVGDEYLRDILEDLGLGSQTLKDVGAVGPAARGAFGHDDMVGQVWEWTATGFGPLAGEEAFDKEFTKFKRDRRYAKLPQEKRQEDLNDPPEWMADRFVLKGGSYFSYMDPVQLHIDVRHRLPSTETMAGAGFRLAKSQQPGRDAAYSLINSDYDLSVFPDKRAPNLEDQVGVERYELSNEGLIRGYHTVSLVPANFLREGRAPNFRKIEEELRVRPELVATLLTTETLGSPALAPGLYSVYYRPAGKPADLEKALNDGNREKMEEDARRRAAERRGQAYVPTVPDPSSSEWRTIIKRYGIDESELEGEDAPDKINYIRLNPGNVTVPTDSAQLILRDNKLEYRMAVAIETAPVQQPGYQDASMTLDHVAGLERFTFTFGLPLVVGDRKPLRFEMSLTLTTLPDPSWRLPANSKIVVPGEGDKVGKSDKPGTGK